MVMRRTLIAAVAVLATSLMLCAASAMLVERSVDNAVQYLASAQKAARTGDTAQARTHMRRLSDQWEADGRWLELLTAHDALADVRGDIADALLCLDSGDRQEFLRACAGVSADLERLKMTEAVRVMNLF